MSQLPHYHPPQPAPAFVPAALALLAALTMAIPAPASAQTETTSVRVHVRDNAPRSPAATRRLLRRIGDAAIEACGGSSFSLVETKRAIVASQCWHDSVADAARHVGDPQVTVAMASWRP